MNRCHFCFLLGALWLTGTQAGEIVEVKDPRYFSQQQRVIFEKAEVKLVTFEFEALGNDGQGKKIAKELHDKFLANIADLHGGAIITYVTPPGSRIENYRVAAEQVGRQQRAQMVLWGRVLADQARSPLISARLMLVELPPGISAEYSGTDRNRNLTSQPPVEVQGVVDAPVVQSRINFGSVENDVTAIARFLSGLARYYKGAGRSGPEAKRWLEGSIDDFKEYLEKAAASRDAAALSQAHLYLARAYVRLSSTGVESATGDLKLAQTHAEQAARLNPYDGSIATAQAVIAARQRSDPGVIESYLERAARLSPTDSNARMNLAAIQSVHGKMKEAAQQIDQAGTILKAQKKSLSPVVEQYQRELTKHQGSTQ